MKTYYDILEINKDATPKEIKKAFYSLAKKYHPDTTPFDKEYGQEKFKEIEHAYKILSNPQTRAAYDNSLKNIYEEQERLRKEAEAKEQQRKQEEAEEQERRRRQADIKEQERQRKVWEEIQRQRKQEEFERQRKLWEQRVEEERKRYQEEEFARQRREWEEIQRQRKQEENLRRQKIWEDVQRKYNQREYQDQSNSSENVKHQQQSGFVDKLFKTIKGLFHSIYFYLKNNSPIENIKVALSVSAFLLAIIVPFIIQEYQDSYIDVHSHSSYVSAPIKLDNWGTSELDTMIHRISQGAFYNAAHNIKENKYITSTKDLSYFNVSIQSNNPFINFNKQGKEVLDYDTEIRIQNICGKKLFLRSITTVFIFYYTDSPYAWYEIREYTIEKAINPQQKINIKIPIKSSYPLPASDLKVKVLNHLFVEENQNKLFYGEITSDAFEYKKAQRVISTLIY